jgi:hypothetical protein
MSGCIESSKDLNLGIGEAIGVLRGVDGSLSQLSTNDFKAFKHLSAIIINIYLYLVMLAMRGKKAIAVRST